jgi:hypothetical protein
MPKTKTKHPAREKIVSVRTRKVDRIQKKKKGRKTPETGQKQQSGLE